jgi:hypothetical protein
MPLSFAAKTTIAYLIVGTSGPSIQMIFKVDYLRIPLVFFILLITVVLLYFAPWWWMPISAILAGIFLTAGLFLSGTFNRLISFDNPGRSVGLWIQTLGFLGALITSSIAPYKNYHNQGKSRNFQLG